MLDTEQVLKTAVRQFAYKWSVLLSPIDAVSKHVEAALGDFAVSSQTALDKSRDRAEAYDREKRRCAEVYDRFLTLKKDYKAMSDRDGLYVYYYLCSVEALPSPQREAELFRATVFLSGEPEMAKAQFSKAVHE